MSVSVAAIILAAGQSKRMKGRNKMLVDVGGRPMIRVVAEMVLASEVDLVVVVTGFEAEAVTAALSGLDLSFVYNSAFEAGMASSLKAGVAALPDEVAGALICLGDMPDVKEDDIRHIVRVFDESNGVQICIPVHEGRRGNPVLLPRWLFAEVEDISGDTGARSIVAAHEGMVMEVPVSGSGIHHDMDTRGDLERKKPGL